MKKNYIVPTVEVEFIEQEEMIAASLDVIEGTPNDVANVNSEAETSSADVWTKEW